MRDPRLLHWFVQNYDLTGCNIYSGCAPAAVSAKLVRKVTPIPLGVDMHTVDDRNWVAGTKQPACDQQAELDAAAAASPPLLRRRLAVLHAFACNDTWPERVRACAELRGCSERRSGGPCMPINPLAANNGRKTRR